MSLLSLGTTVVLPEQNIWYEITINVHNPFKVVPSDLIRGLSNNKQSIGGRTNREWWKTNVITGYYITRFTQTGLEIVLYLNLKREINHMDFKIRVKKMCGLGSKVRVVRTQHLLIPQEFITLNSINDGVESVLEMVNSQDIR